MRIRGSVFLLGAVLTIVQVLAGEVPGFAASSADALVARGIELRRQGRDEEALAEFQKALEMEATPRTRAQVGLAEQALGLWVAAEAHLLEALSHDSDSWVKKNAPVLNKALTVIQSQIGTLQVWGTPPGAAVFVNAKPAGTLPLKNPIRISGESALLTVNADGYVEMQRTVRVPARETVREHVELVPVPVAAHVAKVSADDGGHQVPPSGAPGEVPVPARASAGPEASASDRHDGVSVGAAPDTSGSVLRPIAWVAAVGAAGALTFAVVESVLRQRNKDAFNNYAKPNLADPQNPIKNYCGEASLAPECVALKKKFDSSNTWMIVGYASAGALAIASGILFAKSPSTDAGGSPPARLACIPQFGSPGLTCRVAF